MVIQVVEKFAAFHGTRRFITVFTRSRQCSLSWASWIQSTLHTVSIRYIIFTSFPKFNAFPDSHFGGTVGLYLLFMSAGKPEHWIFHDWCQSSETPLHEATVIFRKLYHIISDTQFTAVFAISYGSPVWKIF